MSWFLQLTEEWVAAIPASGQIRQLSVVARGGLGKDGRPLSGADEAIAAALRDAPAGCPVTLVLPARAVRSRRLMLDLPVDGTVRQSLLVQCHRELEDATDIATRAILYRHPSGYLLDGEPGIGDPVGRQGRLLTIDASVLCADIRELARFERVILGAGYQLSDIIAPHLSAAAAMLGPDGTGTCFHIGFGESYIACFSDHQLCVAATLPVGRRHLLTDIVHATGASPESAALWLESYLSKAPPDIAEGAAEAISARLNEIVDWLARILASRADQNTVFLGGLAMLPVIRDRFFCSLGTLSSGVTDPHTGIAALLGAPKVARGEFASHDVARLSVPGIAARSGRVFRWLQAHF